MSTPNRPSCPPDRVVRVEIGNLTARQKWALEQVLELFTDPANLDLLAGFVGGARAIHIDQETGVVSVSAVISVEDPDKPSPASLN